MLFREEEKNVRDEFFFFFPENVIDDDDESRGEFFRDGSRRERDHWRRDDAVLRAE